MKLKFIKNETIKSVFLCLYTIYYFYSCTAKIIFSKRNENNKKEKEADIHARIVYTTIFKTKNTKINSPIETQTQSNCFLKMKQFNFILILC